MTEQRLQPEDYETLRQAQFTFEERLRNLETRTNTLYATEHLESTTNVLRNEIEDQRRQVFVALGVEQVDTENDQLT